MHSRATHPTIVERVQFEDDVQTFRISTNTLGSGFVEAISNDTLLAIRDAQPAEMRGDAVSVPVLEANGAPRIGRFGWKSQHASLESFAADAYLNEMGITTPLFPEENTSAGHDVGYGTDTIPSQTRRTTASTSSHSRTSCAPPRRLRAAKLRRTFLPASSCSSRSVATPAIRRASRRRGRARGSTAGSCRCHRRSGTGSFIPTAISCCTTSVRATAFRSSRRRSSRPLQAKIRTAPLWALRTRNRLMHDGLSFTFQEAIARHEGQATPVTNAYNALSDAAEGVAVQVPRFALKQC